MRPLSSPELSELVRRFGSDLASAGPEPMVRALQSEQFVRSTELVKVLKAKTAPEATDYWHADILLDQMADLLDRGLRLRDAWHDLAIRSHDARTLATESFSLEAIRRDEEAAGSYRIPVVELKGQLEAANARVVALQTANTRLADMYKTRFSDAARSADVARSAAFGYTSVYPVFWKDLQVGGEWNYKFPWDAGEMSQSSRGYEYARLERERSLDIEAAVLSLQMQQVSAQLSVAMSEQKFFADKLEFETVNATCRRRRAEAQFLSAQSRNDAMTKPGDSMNYQQRMDALRGRFENDFIYALRRARAAQKGVKDVFGFQEPLPAAVVALLDGEQPSLEASPFDDCISWVRQAINWVVDLTRRDQVFTFAVSARRQYTSPQSFEAARDRGRLKISLDDDVLNIGAASHVRIRALTAFVKASDHELWDVSIKLPEASRYRHTFAGSVVPVDQRAVPIVRIGRVTSRNSLREPDSQGSDAVINTAPFGEWNIELPKTSVTGPSSRDAIEDIELHLQLAYHG